MNDDARKLESLLEERTAQLKNLERELESLGFSISHDLRAPLRAIIGFADLLREEYADKLPPEGKRYIDLLWNQARQLNEMIGALLHYSRIGRQPMNLVLLDVKGLVTETFALLSSQQLNCALELKIGELPPAWADRDLLGIVWRNLLDNAIKFTRPKSVRIVEVSGATHSEGVVYHVKDNGVGFDPRYADRLFGMFQKLHPSGSFEGIGAGLAIAQRIVNRHGGRIWAESELGVGASFHFM
ncbi:MAG: ATP-binding protein, partial [Verrucomicrobiae bacterium]|nr:ATP-binding protein [Verrucomicrobiae bacterium]